MTFGDTLRRYRRRRRLSQLELAIRAGTTQRHLSFVESGRSAPGRDLVVRLGTSLELPAREQNALLLAAGFAPLVPESDPEGPELEAVRDALRRLLQGHRPYPALVIDRYGDVLATNDAIGVLTDGAAPELTEGRWNAYRMALHPKGMVPRVRNPAHWSRHVLGNLRAELDHNPDERLASLITELESYAPPSADVPHLGPAVPLELSSPHGDLRLLAMIATFSTAHDVTVAELRLETFLPTDDDTATRLHHYS
ncbi:helix-turn-helix domain-containing protein [Actinomadura kijaniata]|uniref:helix-turn-helix domain-containing protein n=1 Tax=Actinomadura kijaniata TaxID=46161 RepID=UPI003F1B68F8